MIMVAIFATSSGYAATAKCKVLPKSGVSAEEKIVEVVPTGSGTLTTFGDFSLMVENYPDKTLAIVLIDGKRGALVSAPFPKDSNEGRAQVGIVDQNWVYHATGSAHCVLQ